MAHLKKEKKKAMFLPFLRPTPTYVACCLKLEITQAGVYSKIFTSCVLYIGIISS